MSERFRLSPELEAALQTAADKACERFNSLISAREYQMDGYGKAFALFAKETTGFLLDHWREELYAELDAKAQAITLETLSRLSRDAYNAMTGRGEKLK